MAETKVFGWLTVDSITAGAAPPFAVGAKLYVPKECIVELESWWAEMWSTDFRAYVQRIHRIDKTEVVTEQVWTYKKFGPVFILLKVEPGANPITIPKGWIPMLAGKMPNWFSVPTGTPVPKIPSVGNWTDGGAQFEFVRKVIKCIVVLWLTGVGRSLLDYVNAELDSARHVVTIRPAGGQKFVCLHDGDHNRNFEDRYLDGAACAKFANVPLQSGLALPVLEKIYLSKTLGDLEQCIGTGAPFPVWLNLAHEMLHALRDEIAPDAMDTTGQPKFSIVTGGPAPSEAVLRDYSQVKMGPIPAKKIEAAFYEMLAVHGRYAPQKGYADVGVGLSENQIRAAYDLAKREKYYGPFGPKVAKDFVIPAAYSTGSGLTQADAGLTGGGLDVLGLPVFAKK